MKFFCPNCGQPNEAASPGARVTCSACTAMFDAPAAPGPAPAPAWPVPSAPQEGWPQKPQGQKTNTLAIVSLVSGVLCCIPFASVVALVTGILAMKQIDRNSQESGKGLAIAGIVLGALGFVGGVLAVLANLLAR
ncbi:MAG: DUF4190 domain-containing protein [Myxococcota bacterium]